MKPAATDLWFLDTRIRILVPAASSEDRLSVMSHWAPYGHSPPLHVHDTEDEVFHVVEGALRFAIGDRTVTARAGETILAPKGIPHSFVVDSAAGARFMTVTTPGDFEAMVRAASRPAEAEGLPPMTAPPTPEMAEALARLCAANGIRLIGEPLAPLKAA